MAEDSNPTTGQGVQPKYYLVLPIEDNGNLTVNVVIDDDMAEENIPTTNQVVLPEYQLVLPTGGYDNSGVNVIDEDMSWTTNYDIGELPELFSKCK